MSSNMSEGVRRSWGLEMDTEQPFPDFNDWFSSTVDEVRPQVVVAIARGGMRLLQLQDAMTSLDDGVLLVCHHALPFISDSEIHGRRVLLFDDSVIFGSTMSKTRDYLVRRGAVVSCASYTVDRENFYGESDSRSAAPSLPSPFCSLPIRVKHKLWSEGIQKHHDILVRSILRTPNHYNLDFPTFRFKLPRFLPGEIPFMARLLSAAGLFDFFCDVCSPASAKDGIYRYTGLVAPSALDPFATDRVSLRPYSKVRVTLVPDVGEIRITPIVQLAVDQSVSYDDVTFSEDIMSDLWRTMQPPRAEPASLYHEAMFRLLTSFIAVMLGEHMSRLVTSALQTEFPVSEMQLVEEDIGFVIGPANRQAMGNMLSRLSAAGRNLVSHCSARNSYVPQEPVNPALVGAVSNVWRQKRNLKPNPGDLVHEMLGKTFLALRAATDSPECRRRNPQASRLDVGLTYCEIQRLLHDECGIDVSPQDLSVAMDICVDNGQAVPKVVLDDSLWMRVFYSGENEDSQDALQFKRLVHSAYSQLVEQRSGTHLLSPFDMHKLCVTLKDFFPFLPISSRYYTYGRCASVGRDDVELIEWLANPNGGPFKIGFAGDRSVLLPNQDYVPCVQPTWRPRQMRDVHDAFVCTAKAFSSMSDEGKLLLSTCRTYRHAHNAVAVEAHHWAKHAHSMDFGRFLSGVETMPSGAVSLTPSAVSALHWCIRYISEAMKKYDIFFNRFDALREEVRLAYKKQGSDSERFWTYFVDQEGFLNPSQEEEDVRHRFQVLMPLLDQMACLTTFAARTLLDGGILKRDTLEREFAGQGSSLNRSEFAWVNGDSDNAAKRYNDNIRAGRIPGRSIVKTLLKADLPPEGLDSMARLQWYIILVRQVRQCYQELKNCLMEYCPEYQVAEGQFPFSPDSRKRVRPDGSVERDLSDQYVLAMDIIGSTDSGEVNAFKDYIVETLRRFRSRADSLHFELTGDDCFVVCSDNPGLLWDIAMSIMLQGETVRRGAGRLGGTRKALYFGPVQVVEGQDGSVMIRDASVPHTLPRVCSILPEIDGLCDKRSVACNLTIVIEERTAKQASQLLGLTLDNELVMVSGKHFTGRCYIVNMVNEGRRSG